MTNDGVYKKCRGCGKTILRGGSAYCIKCYRIKTGIIITSKEYERMQDERIREDILNIDLIERGISLKKLFEEEVKEKKERDGK